MAERFDILPQDRYHGGIGLYPTRPAWLPMHGRCRPLTVMSADVHHLLNRKAAFGHECFQVQQQFASSTSLSTNCMQKPSIAAIAPDISGLAQRRVFLYHEIVSLSPEAKSIEASKPKDVRACETSRRRNGWPFGFDVSHLIVPQHPVEEARQFPPGSGWRFPSLSRR